MGNGSDRWSVLAATLLFEGMLAILALVVGYWLNVPVLADLRWDLSAVAWGVVATIPMWCLFWVLVTWPMGPFAIIKKILDDTLLVFLRPCHTIDLAMISLVAGVGEEMLFRGLLQGWLASVWGVYPALVIASVVFGLGHFITPTYALFAGLLGAYLGGLWLVSGNLLAPILAHGLYDFFALVYLLRRTPPAPLL